MRIFVNLFISLRQSFWTLLAKRKINEHGKGLKCNHRSSFNRNTYIGNNCNFNGMIVYGTGKVTIGDYFHSGSECQIITSFHNYDSGTKIPYDDTFITKNVTIGNNVWIGNNVIILGGTTIGDGAIIQAGSVLCGGSIPPLGIAGGHPAKVFKYRNEEHYYSLVSKGCFY